MCIRDSLTNGMELARTGAFVKSNTLSSAVRNASCSRGWLRLLVQSIFAAVTVASFILIVLMAIPVWPPPKSIYQGSRCEVHTCRIICRDAPFFGQYKVDIIHALSEADEHCQSIILSLNNAMFMNNTVPSQWLSSLGRDIHELNIIGGNLMHLSPDAFLSQYTASIRILVFHNLVLKSWTADSLVGLSSLRHLYIKDCIIVDIPRDVLRTVDDTLQTLTIIRSEYWNPTNITGRTRFLRLTSVDFSQNIFKRVLGVTSFTGLQTCKVLYLNSCRISAIGTGTFDSLLSIEMLFLHNNHLVTIPDGLFRNILAVSNPKPRINLQDNLWYCDCSLKEVRTLLNEDMLLTNPDCHSPDHFKDKTFTDLNKYCAQQSSNNAISKHSDFNLTDDVQETDRIAVERSDVNVFLYISDDCYNGNETSSTVPLKMYSPVFGHGCNTKGPPENGIDIVPRIAMQKDKKILLQNSWIKVTYFLKTLSYSMVQIGALDSDDYGLVWYQSTCPNEVYCVNDVPSIMRIYNVNMQASYVFCPMLLNTGIVEIENCVYYHLATFDYEDVYNRLQIMLYIATGTVCLIFGAICVYAVIRQNPNLLKGSKRILFVKHKTVDVLVLPPKIPIRNSLVNEATPNSIEKKIFTVPANYVFSSEFDRNISVRSSKSSSPSYISAVIPNDEQLAEWRIAHHFNNYLSTTPARSELPSLSWISSDDARHYSLDADNERTYESLK